MVVSMGVTAAQEIVAVPSVTGQAIMKEAKSLEKAKQKAKQNAYIKALKKAGVPVHVNVLQSQMTRQANNETATRYMESINATRMGEVVPKKVLKSERSINNLGQPIYQYTMRADVVKRNPKSDPNFKVQIGGLDQRIYKEGETFKYRIKPTKSCYLTLFNIATANNTVQKLYPNDQSRYLKQKKLQEGEVHTIPAKGAFDARLPDGTSKQANRYIFVFTKDKITFNKTASDELESLKAITKWIHQIPPTERFVKYKHFDIVKPGQK